mmetsp:Transcript_9729/g.34532  ORF Transcript_9729/g.34532 Transcript_9729/m.34532 type:complete len:683 (-) Transcript_9729:86-2134(-)
MATARRIAHAAACLLIARVGAAEAPADAPATGRASPAEATASEVHLRGVFPNYDDPITAEPNLPHPSASRGEPCAQVKAIVGAKLTGWGQIARGRYEPPEGCPSGSWHQIVFELSGAVAGVQFDRFGAVWFRGVEILRTTTPEPSPKGIVWKVVKDLTEYASLFEEPGDVAIAIPSVITSTYTGVLNINITLSFFAAKDGSSTPEITTKPPQVLPLRNMSKVASPFANLTVPSAVGQVNMVKIPGNIREAHLDLYASGHSCEEFWYTNLINSTGPESCAGGAYRELNVYVDGHLAGAQHPFPVLYTGGMNPLLWRPLTGILSLDIPAYRFDLTPFLAWLIDGQAHNITLSVVGNYRGNWFLNGVLILHEAPQGVSGGSVEILPADPRVFEETSQNESNTLVVQKMQNTAAFHVRGSLLLGSGQQLTSEIEGHLTAWSVNRFEGADSQETAGRFYSVLTSYRNGAPSRSTISNYPLEVKDFSAQDRTTFQLNACVKFDRNIDTTFGSDYVVVLQNHMESCAVYNRSLTNRSQINVQEDQAQEHFKIYAGPTQVDPRRPEESNLCYERTLAAHDGAITASDGHNTCTWPHGVYVCGSDLCGEFSTAGEGHTSEMADFGGSAPSGVLRMSAALPDDGLGGDCLLPMRRLPQMHGPPSKAQWHVTCHPKSASQHLAWSDTPRDVLV